MKRIIYGKIGRSIILNQDKFGPVGGDMEPIFTLDHLARRHPDIEWVVGSRWTGDPSGLPSNVTLPPLPKVEPRNHYDKAGNRFYDESRQPWAAFEEVLRPYFETADGVVLWAGQMGTTNYPIPKVEDRSILTSPQDSFMTYCAPILQNLNRWRDVDPRAHEEVWLVSDARNYLKARDIKWPPGEIISHYDTVKKQPHERYGDERQPEEFKDLFNAHWRAPGVWEADHHYKYYGLEIVSGVPETWAPELGFEDRRDFGIVINEARSYVGTNRAPIVRDWVVPLLKAPTDIVGKWSPSGVEVIGITPLVISHEHVPTWSGRYKCTLTTPSSGSGWATTKWWEMAAVGTVCFCHPKWDDQGHIIPTTAALDANVWDQEPALEHFFRWLRVETPAELAAKVKAVSESRETYEWLRDMQSWWLAKARHDDRALSEIERRLGLPCPFQTASTPNQS